MTRVWRGEAPYNPLEMPPQRWDDQCTGYEDAMNSPEVVALYRAAKILVAMEGNPFRWAVARYEEGLRETVEEKPGP